MKVIEDFDLTDYNGYNIFARCKKVFLPDNESDILEVAAMHPDILLLGSGHNIILSQTYYEQPMMIFNGNFNAISKDPSNLNLVVEAGALMADVSNFALENSLSGIEVFYDIPSSMGGAVVMNAGASGEEIKDVIMKVRYLNLIDLSIYERSADQIGFEYRNSFFQQNPKNIVLKAWLNLPTGEYKNIADKMDLVKKTRWQKQPREFPSCGSVFKRPQGMFVGPMLDALGLKGFRIGGAMISEKHSGFIINVDNASGSNILSVIAEVKKRVKDSYGIDLEIEQRVI
ncbi:UDP-N-acetylmuramate dehydrogenase [Fluviicola chungangensis]|uniref:UDP-N-acetylenolpyruvoylglucosamine reductase n=1 Tax=Fluviicola chungangensis TaxID=2597671 RepID=A0A556N0S8_9FLAO|nr:UDP-N-acetylmuramate dehydrogenase [Fluviicola chungangensis]TSJ45802.1 UDP-N-acetylmuramate dehydrogenase [Fluviicola chungangensis]